MSMLRHKCTIAFFLLAASFNFLQDCQAEKYPYGVVVSENKIAAQVGAGIMQAGGNAIDAAVAVGYALAVVFPCCGNIGGGGFMTLHLANGDNIFINFREKAPLKASNKLFLQTVDKNASIQGYLSVAVPGSVLGLETVLKKYGTMPRHKVMAPAIKLAAQGFILSAEAAKQFQNHTEMFKRQANVAAIFLKQGKPYQKGQLFIQKALAHTLMQIAKYGPQVFYQGEIAQTIVKASEANKGILSLADFSQYTVQILKPLVCHYRGYTIYSAPPPSSGGTTVCEILQILQNFPLKQLGYRSAITIRYIVEAMRYGFMDRNSKLGDPDFVNNPIQELISDKYTKAISQRIAKNSVEQQGNPPQHESKQTTHYSIVDKYGNAVAVTTTINGFFGAGVMAGNTGFFLNNEMDDFATMPGKPNKFGLVQQDTNAIAPGKRPLSSMSPTIVMKENKLYMILGSPGGPHIITAVLLTLLNKIDFGMSLQAAVGAPRFHYQEKPDEIMLEPNTFTPVIEKQLLKMGYHLKTKPGLTAVESILIDPKPEGVSDPRRKDGGVAIARK